MPNKGYTRQYADTAPATAYSPILQEELEQMEAIFGAERAKAILFDTYNAAVSEFRARLHNSAIQSSDLLGRDTVTLITAAAAEIDRETRLRRYSASSEE